VGSLMHKKNRDLGRKFGAPARVPVKMLNVHTNRLKLAPVHRKESNQFALKTQAAFVRRVPVFVMTKRYPLYESFS
jgi:hypothetical protein